MVGSSLVKPPSPDKSVLAENVSWKAFAVPPEKFSLVYNHLKNASIL